MRHFSFLDAAESSRLFHLQPDTLSIRSPPELLAVALGATLYCPGDRPNIAKDVLKQAARGCVSMVLCLEDSIADTVVNFAETNVAQAVAKLHHKVLATGGSEDAGLPLLFIRVRTPEQMLRVAQMCGDSLAILSGFVVPKFTNGDGYAQRFFDALHEIQRFNVTDARNLRIMPILESPVMIHSESRSDALAAIFEVTTQNRSDVLAVRIGATDLSSTFGLRRSRDLTVYDVKVVASVISDIVNVFGRHSDNFVITGTVWEHYETSERIMRPQLRMTPFLGAVEARLRKKLILTGMDGLIREISLDHANGLLGKTVIHPSHVSVVHALSVVSHEEYLDASAVLRNIGGASASPYKNKMNETKPHFAWAEKTVLRARAFGVAAESTTFVDLLEASMR